MQLRFSFSFSLSLSPCFRRRHRAAPAPTRWPLLQPFQHHSRWSCFWMRLISELSAHPISLLRSMGTASPLHPPEGSNTAHTPALAQ